MAFQPKRFFKSLEILGNLNELLWAYGDPSGSVSAVINKRYWDLSTGQIYRNTDGATAWVYTGLSADVAAFQDEFAYLRAFVGKNAAGSEMPDYSSTTVISDGDSLETASGKLDADIGPDSAITPAARTNGPVIAANSLKYNVNALDDAIGADTLPVARTNNPIVAANSVNANIDALDAGIGADPASQNYVDPADPVNDNISALDAALYGLSGLVSAGVRWVAGGGVIALTADDISGYTGLANTFSDDEGGYITSQTAGQRFASTFDNKIWVASVGAWTIATDGNLVDRDTFGTQYNFLRSPADQEGPGIERFNGTTIVEDLKIDFETANTIKLTGSFAPGAPFVAVATSDTIQQALQKAMGTIGPSSDLTPLTRSVGQLSIAETLARGLDRLDTAVGADASLTPLSRTTGAVSNANDTKQNFEALDNYAGSDADLAILSPSVPRALPTNSANKNLNALDFAIGNGQQKPAPTTIAFGVTATADSVAVALAADVDWRVIIARVGTLTDRVSFKIHASNDGSAGVQDDGQYDNQNHGTPPAYSLTVDISAGNMRLRVTNDEVADSIKVAVTRVFTDQVT